MANQTRKSGLCLLAALAVLLPCVPSVSAHESDARAGSGLTSRTRVTHKHAFKHALEANALASSDASASRHVAAAKGPYYIDFRARTAASWGHAFVWYGKTSERQVEVAGLTPAGNTLTYMLGYVMWVPSETGASYGDLDPEYLTASYRIYLSEADAKRVFAYIKHLQENSPLWSAEVSNCTSFIGSIASYMGLKTPLRWTRPEEYVKKLKELNGGRQVIQLSAEQ